VERGENAGTGAGGAINQQRTRMEKQHGIILKLGMDGTYRLAP